MFFIEALLSVTAARLISLLNTSTPRSVPATAIDCTDANGIPTRASVAGRQTMIDLFPLSLGLVRNRGRRHWITRRGVICAAMRYGIYVSVREICSNGAGVTAI